MLEVRRSFFFFVPRGIVYMYIYVGNDREVDRAFRRIYANLSIQPDEISPCIFLFSRELGFPRFSPFFSSVINGEFRSKV